MVKQEKILVILGNGFDVNIGLPTKYSQFLESPVFKSFLGLTSPGDPGRYANHHGLKQYNLMYYIDQKYHFENWSDLESLLYQYAKNGREEVAPNGKLMNQNNVSDENRNMFFNMLRQSLWAYLKSISYQNVNASSQAAKLLTLLSSRPDITVWSFNYTDLNVLLPILHIDRLECAIKHVHGTIVNDDIILGFQSDADVDDSYSYMKKLNDPRHNFSGFTKQLIDASKVVVFGHSLGESDKDYFSEYFKFLATEDSMDKPREVTIITWDVASAKSIVDNISTLSGNHLAAVKSHVTLNIVKTATEHASYEQIFSS